MSVKLNKQLISFFMAGISTISMVFAVANPAFSKESRYVFQGNGVVKENGDTFSCQHLIVHSTGSAKLTCNNYQLSLGRPRQVKSGKLYYRTLTVKKKNTVYVYSGDIGCSIRVGSNAQNNTLEKFSCAGVYGDSIFEAKFNATRTVTY